MVQNPKCKRVDMMFQDIWIKTIIVQNSEEGEGREGKKKFLEKSTQIPRVYHGEVYSFCFLRLRKLVALRNRDFERNGVLEWLYPTSDPSRSLNLSFEG